MSIAEFVVGLGMDSSDFNRGIQGAERKLGAFKSTILQTGAALGAAFTFKGLTFDFAKQVNEARQLAQFLGVSTNNLVSMQRVAQSFGADIGEMNSLFAGIAQAKSGVQVGQIGVFQELAKAGIDVDDLIGAKDANEAILRLASQMEKLKGIDARKNVAAAIGLTPATLDMMIAGRKRLEELQEKYRELRPVTKEAEKASKEWIAGLTELETRVGRVYDSLATEVLKGVNGIVSGVNSWLESNQELIDQVTGPTFKFVGEHIGAIAVGLGALGSAPILGGLGKLVRILGGVAVQAGKLGATAAKLGGAATVAGIGRATAALGGMSGVLSGMAASATVLGGVLSAIALWDINPEDLFGKDAGKFLNMTPGELFAYMTSPDRNAKYLADTMSTVDIGAAITPAASSGDMAGAADVASQANAGAASRATVRATIPIQITTNTNLPESTLTRSVTKVMNRELDAALIRGEYGN